MSKRIFSRRREFYVIRKATADRSFINTVAGWVNLLLMSASGPVKIPVGAW
jgi:fatty acid synthase subunit alpha